MDPQEAQLEFEPVENQRQVLGQSISSLSGPPPEPDEDEGISELVISGSYMLVRLRSIQSGAYDDANAALLIFDVTFQPAAPDKYRFKSARFEITFQGQSEILPYTSTPRVLSFAPVWAAGEITQVKRKWEFTSGVTASVPLAPLAPELELSISSSTKYTAEHKMIIQGFSRPPSKPFKISWTLTEKKLVREGLPHTCAFAAIVSADGPYFATFKSEAEVGSGSLSRGIISKKSAKYTRRIDPQTPMGPQFTYSGGKFDLKKLDINSRYAGTLGTFFNTNSKS